ncbi:glycosyltransferase [Porticoccaceae bacterium]|nr:glycosyltransferase [Porticoccaceae bacterium]
MKIIHIIGSLRAGGAEHQLARIAIEQAKRNCDVLIILFDCFTTPLEVKCVDNKVKLINVGIRRDSIFRGVLKLFRELNKADQPRAIFQSWMYGADLLLSIWGLLRIFSKGNKANIFWNIRCTKFTGFTKFSLKRYIVALSCIPLSYIIPKKIVNCANAAKIEHEKWLYDKSKLVVIHNCFDEAKFSANKNKQCSKKFVLGFVGRNDPIKNFPAFVSIIGDLVTKDTMIEAHIAGRGYNPDEEVPLKLKKYFYFKGEISKMSDFYKSIDLLVVTSFSEGFPNVIVEAGLSGVDCISFDVGDASYILPNKNIIKNRSIETMLSEIKQYICTKSKISRLKNRERLVGKFNIKSTVDCYEKMYLDVIDKST